jgi:UDP-N-acetylmuramoylalanine--D-glutamate ligase
MNVLVLGGGTSGFAASKLLLKRGHSVTVCDNKKIPPQQKTLFEALQVSVYEENVSDDLLKDKDGLCISPGVSPKHPLIVAAKRRQLLIQSEIDLALESFSGTSVAVTGTNGKSTIAKMIEHILDSAGKKVAAVGNIGTPPSLLIADELCPDIFVLELSSYQLESSNPIKSDVAIFSNFSEDHLERHGNLQKYFKAKWKILQTWKPNSLALLSPEVFRWSQDFNLVLNHPNMMLVDEYFMTTKGISALSTGLHTKHNQFNAAFALAASSHICQVPISSLCHHLVSYQGLPHRCQEFTSIKGVKIVNDSKATNIASTLAALESYQGPLTLMLGGQSKGEDFGPVLNHLDKISQIICFGASGAKIGKELETSNRVKIFTTLTECLDHFPEYFSTKDCLVLFSPACASFDEFKNFEERGTFFQTRLQKLAGLNPSST